MILRLGNIVLQQENVTLMVKSVNGHGLVRWGDVGLPTGWVLFLGGGGEGLVEDGLQEGAAFGLGGG